MSTPPSSNSNWATCRVGVRGSARQGWVVDYAPTNLQNCPTNGGIISTPLPIKLLSLASPSRPLELKSQ